MNPDQSFDEAMRARYREATTQLSARSHAQLQQRLRAALVRDPGTNLRSPVWRSPARSLAVACALMLAVVVGVRWQSGQRRDAASPIAASIGDDDIVAALDENPDLYLWLASDDAVALAAE